MLNASSMPQLPRSTRKLELNGLQRLLAAISPHRLVVAGGPRAGKTTLAESLGYSTHHTSADIEDLGWSESSLAASFWFDEPGPWACDGVQMARALRKWLARNPEGTPADMVVHLVDPVVPRMRGQHVMTRGCVTVMNEITPELLRRGVQLIEF